MYWQSVRAMVRGEPLFRSVYASQPPAFYLALLPFYLVSHSLAALRISVLLFAIAGLAAAYAAARMLAGPQAGLVALILLTGSPLYIREATIVQADMPAVATMLVAIALAIATTRRRPHKAILLSALTGVALAVAVGIKFLAVVAVIPIVVLLMMPRRQSIRILLACAAGGLVALLVIFLPALTSLDAASQQLVWGHLLAGQALHADIGTNLVLLFQLRELPLLLLASSATTRSRWHSPTETCPVPSSIPRINAPLAAS